MCFSALRLSLSFDVLAIWLEFVVVSAVSLFLRFAITTGF